MTARCLPSDVVLAQAPAKLYCDSGVPVRHRRVIDDVKSPADWVTTRDKLRDRIGSGFLVALVGPRGPGKTQLAEQLILATSAIGRTCLYSRAMTFFLELRATYRSEDKTELEVVQRYAEPSLLVLDEFQERGETPWENRMLNHLVDVRYGDAKDTLLVANHTPKTLKASLGDSVSSRLRETGGVVECKWRSFRDPKQEKTES